MSEFLMIVPPGWTELTTAPAFIAEHSEATILDLLARNEGFAAVEALLQDGGYIPPTAALVDFRIFRDAGDVRIWCFLG